MCSLSEPALVIRTIFLNRSAVARGPIPPRMPMVFFIIKAHLPLQGWYEVHSCRGIKDYRSVFCSFSALFPLHPFFAQVSKQIPLFGLSESSVSEKGGREIENFVEQEKFGKLLQKANDRTPLHASGRCKRKRIQ